MDLQEGGIFFLLDENSRFGTGLQGKAIKSIFGRELIMGCGFKLL